MQHRYGEKYTYIRDDQLNETVGAALQKTTQTITMHSSASSSPQAFQSVVDLGFQHSLSPFPTVSGHCLSFFFFFFSPLHFNPFLTHLSIFCMVALFFLLLPPQLLQFFLAFSGFPFFRSQPRINTTK